MESRQPTAEPARKIIKPAVLPVSPTVERETVSADEMIIVTRHPPGRTAASPSITSEPQQKAAAAAYRGYEALVDRTVDVFGDELTASRWLSMPTPDLNGAIPIEVAGTLHYDPIEVQKLFDPIFIRIEHGIDG